MDHPGVALPLLGRETLRLAQDLRERPDRGHRRPQLMGDLAEEGILLDTERHQLLVGDLELLRCPAQLFRLRFQSGGILHDLLGFVGDLHQVIDRNAGSFR